MAPTSFNTVIEICLDTVTFEFLGVDVMAQAVEQKGATFHNDGYLTYPRTGVPTHALNILIRVKPNIPNAIIIERYPPKSCHSTKCKTSVILSLVKQKLELKVKINGQELKIKGDRKLKVRSSLSKSYKMSFCGGCVCKYPRYAEII